MTLRLAPAARWVVEHHPVESVDIETDGSSTVRMSISALPWLSRLLIRLGPDAEVVDVSGPADVSAADVRRLAADTAATILARYRN